MFHINRFFVLNTKDTLICINNDKTEYMNSKLVDWNKQEVSIFKN